jgi:hypothetical protein
VSDSGNELMIRGISWAWKDNKDWKVKDGFGESKVSDREKALGCKERVGSWLLIFVSEGTLVRNLH